MIRRAALGSALVLITTAVAGCGSSSPGSSGSAANVGTKQSAGIAYARCMRSHGVPTFPDPGSKSAGGGPEIQASQRSGSGASMTINGVAVSAPTFQSAMQACHSYLPNGGRLTATQSAEAHAAALAMSRCMRTHGVPNFPDPTFGTGPGGGAVVRIQIPAGSTPSSPAFQAAQKACQPLGPKRLP